MYNNFKDTLNNEIYNNFKETSNNEKPAENKWAARLAYKCGVCGTEYESIMDRAECEIRCSKKKEEAERLAAAKKKREEQAARKKAVDEAFNKAHELKKEYLKDYGSYEYYYADEDECEEWISTSFADFLKMLP